MLKWPDVVRFANNGNPPPDKRVEKTPEEWKALLTPEQFNITRLKGTERAFSSELCSYFEPGRYSCICCGTELFDADTKFESGTGWPSFTQPVKENAVAYHKDSSFGMLRIEALCNTCDAHLGHVFQDGPKPSGLRYCMNALSLRREKIEIHAGEEGISFFSLHVGGQEVGRMKVHIKDGILKAGYTSVGLTQRKNGYGGKLVTAVVNYARKNNLKIIPECGFVAMLFNKYPDTYGDIRATS